MTDWFLPSPVAACDAKSIVFSDLMQRYADLLCVLEIKSLSFEVFFFHFCTLMHYALQPTGLMIPDVILFDPSTFCTFTLDNSVHV